MTLTEWLHYIQTIHVSAIDLGLDRVCIVAEKLNLTSFDCPVITVAGTNGKGSTIRALEQIYRQAGYKVAAYTSPHLIDFCERLRIDDQQLAEAQWCETFEKIEVMRGEVTLSFFEFTLLAALLICTAIEPDILLLEVGLGGRLDAVNIVENDIAILTSVGLDHTEWLGGTREKIAAEKAAITRRVLISGDLDPPMTIEKICREKQAQLFQIGRDFNYRDLGESWFFEGLESRFIKLKKPSLLLSNVACALVAIELLQPQLPVTQMAVLTAMNKMSLPGRYEIINTTPRIIFDVAHNAHAAEVLKVRLLTEPGKIHAVFAALSDKDIDNMLRLFKGVFSSWFVADLSSEKRGLSAEAILVKMTTVGIKNCYNGETVSTALTAAIDASTPKDTIVVWGSFHTVGQAKQWMKEVRYESAI